MGVFRWFWQSTLKQVSTSYRAACDDDAVQWYKNHGYNMYLQAGWSQSAVSLA